MIGFVVPTLGVRESALDRCIQSVLSNDISEICIVAPVSVCDIIATRYPEVHTVTDPCQGLAAAINEGMKALPPAVKYVNWLGDDDELTSGSTVHLCDALEMNPEAVLSYGMCEYVNSTGEKLFLNRSAKWSEVLMRFGPQLVSQPAILIRRESLVRVGGLDESLSYAFDLDLLLRLHQFGTFVRVPHTVAKYCWHEQALTVVSRRSSVDEASDVRRRYLHRFLRPVAPLWELAVRGTIYAVGRLVSVIAMRKSR